MVELSDILKEYSKREFQEVLDRKRKEIEELLNSFINEISNRKVSPKIISRIKSRESLEEKLRRKNYIEKWGIVDNDDSVQSAICEHLPDLFGFRINCYFKDDEEKIFNKLVEFLESKDEIKLETNPNLIQRNGHTIYKIAGKYQEIKNSFCFEVQVKSLIHDTWGEVEHSIIYKSRAYNSYSDLKAGVIDGLYNVLEGAEKQLQKLYTFESSKEEVEFELFYHLTSGDNKNEILDVHYKNFLKLKPFLNHYMQLIEKYIGSKLLNSEFCKESINDDNEISLDKYKEKIDEYKWEKVCEIAKHVYDFTDNDIFLRHIIKQVMDTSQFLDDFEPSFIEEIDDEKIEISDVLGTLSFLLIEH